MTFEISQIRVQIQLLCAASGGLGKSPNLCVLVSGIKHPLSR